MAIVTGNLLMDKKLDKKIRAAQLSGDNEDYNKVKQYYNGVMNKPKAQEDSWKELNDLMDEILDFFYRHAWKLNPKKTDNFLVQSDKLKEMVMEYNKKVEKRDLEESAQEF